MNSLPSLEPDIRVVGVADSVAMAKELIREPMDVALMDYRLRDGTGIEVTRAIKQRWPGARVVMVTAIGDDEMVLESIQAGADGHLTRDRAVADVVAAVRGAYAGETLLPRTVILQISRRVAEALRANVQNVMGKLRVHSKLEAVAFALRQRLVDPLRADGNF